MRFARLADQVAQLVAVGDAELREDAVQVRGDGTADGSFAPVDPAVAAHAVFDATTLFHHPAHATEWQAHGVEAELDAVGILLLNGLAA